MTQQLNTFQEYKVQNSITNDLNDEKFDLNGPFSFIEYLDYAQILDNSTQNIDNYKKYLIEWDSLDLNTGNEETNTIRDQFIILFKDINQNYTTVEERRYLSTIDFNNEENLSIALPFFANKIKEICIYYKQKRNNYLRDLSTIDARGSKEGVQDYIKNAIVDLFFGDQSSTNLNSTLSLSAMQINLEIGIEEGYDIYNDIFDTDTDQSIVYDSPVVLESIEIIQPDGTTTTTTTTTTPQPEIPSTTPKPVLPAQLWEFNDPCEPKPTDFTNSTWFSSYDYGFYVQTQGISQFYVVGDKMFWGINAKTFPFKANQTGRGSTYYWLNYYDINNNYLGWSGDDIPVEDESHYHIISKDAAKTTYYKQTNEIAKPPEGTFTVWLFNDFGAAAINVYNAPFINEEGVNALGGDNLPWIGYPLEETNYQPPITTREDWRADEMPKRPVTIPIFDDYFIPGTKDNTMYFNAWPIHANINVEGTMSFTRGLKDGKETLYADAHWTGTAVYGVNEYQNPFLDQAPPPELNPAYTGSVFPPPVEGEPITFYNGIQKVNFYYTDENDEIIDLDVVDVPGSTHVQYVWDEVGVVTKTACDQFPIDAFNNYEIPANAAFIWLTWQSNRSYGDPSPLERQVCHPLSDIT